MQYRFNHTFFLFSEQVSSTCHFSVTHLEAKIAGEHVEPVTKKWTTVQHSRVKESSVPSSEAGERMVVLKGHDMGHGYSSYPSPTPTNTHSSVGCC